MIAGDRGLKSTKHRQMVHHVHGWYLSLRVTLIPNYPKGSDPVGRGSKGDPGCGSDDCSHLSIASNFRGLTQKRRPN